MSVEAKYLQVLEQYNDKSFVYSVLCSKTSRYYNYWKLGFALPLILTSTVLTYINANDNANMMEAMKIVNPTFNMITAILLGIQNVFKFESKSNEFKNSCLKFQKLSHLIENKIIKKDFGEDFITNIIQQYDDIQEDCMDIPHWICNSVRKEYGTVKHLPIVCNGIQKINKSDVTCDNVIIQEDQSPRVLKHKFLSDLQQ